MLLSVAPIRKVHNKTVAVSFFNGSIINFVAVSLMFSEYYKFMDDKKPFQIDKSVSIF